VAVFAAVTATVNGNVKVIMTVTVTGGATTVAFAQFCLPTCGKIQMQPRPLGTVILGLVFLDTPVCITIGEWRSQPDLALIDRSAQAVPKSPKGARRLLCGYFDWMPIWVSVALRGAVINSSLIRLCKTYLLPVASGLIYCTRSGQLPKNC